MRRFPLIGQRGVLVGSGVRALSPSAPCVLLSPPAAGKYWVDPYTLFWIEAILMNFAELKRWQVRALPRQASPVATPPALACAREVLAHHGNMSSPTVLFILQRLHQQQAPRPCVALGFGPGLTAEAALFW